jgi:hypothetical protein
LVMCPFEIISLVKRHVREEFLLTWSFCAHIERLSFRLEDHHHGYPWLYKDA